MTIVGVECLPLSQNTYDPEKLRIKAMAANFNYASKYLMPFFKRQTGQSQQQNILRYTLSLIEAKLRYSNLSLSQIADEYGFTDISHLHKMFKKHNGIAPRDFRNRHAGK